MSDDEEEMARMRKSKQYQQSDASQRSHFGVYEKLNYQREEEQPASF